MHGTVVNQQNQKPNQRDFNFTTTLDDHLLVPVLPLRINFVLYIRDFISSLAMPETQAHPTLIDLGCGPIAIVSVLGFGAIHIMSGNL